MVYEGLFDSWEDVKREFNTGQVEPEEVLVARYDQEGYEGSALVIFRQGNQIFTVEGGHCSCYGLEDQWEPIGYPLDVFVLLAEQNKHWTFQQDYKDAAGKVKLMLHG